MSYIGIDFGTSNCVVANYRFGQADVLPNREGLRGKRTVVHVFTPKALQRLDHFTKPSFRQRPDAVTPWA